MPARLSPCTPVDPGKTGAAPSCALQRNLPLPGGRLAPFYLHAMGGPPLHTSTFMRWRARPCTLLAPIETEAAACAFACLHGRKAACPCIARRSPFKSSPWLQAVPTALRGCFQACGQNCAGAERFLVHSRVYTQFVQQVSATCRKMRQGPTLGPEVVDAGAMCMPGLAERVHELVQDAVSHGAKVSTLEGRCV